MRQIEYDLLRTICEQSNERYLDVETGYMIAVMNVDLYGRMREVMVAYVAENDYVKLLTIHPLKEGQRESRIKSGRWRKI